MSCEYCIEDSEKNLIHYKEKRRNRELWVYLDNGRIVVENEFYDAPPTESAKINFCPICGSKLGD